MRGYLSHVYCHGSYSWFSRPPPFAIPPPRISPEFPRFPVYRDTDRACVPRRVTVASIAACSAPRDTYNLAALPINLDDDRFEQQWRLAGQPAAKRHPPDSPPSGNRSFGLDALWSELR